jgi:hypothetical protein
MKLKLLMLFAFLMLPVGKMIHAETDVNNAQAIFIYNFLSQVRWPEGSAEDKLTVGILGKTTTTEYLRKYTENRKIGAKPIEVVEYSSSADISSCHVLFLTYNKSNEISAVDEKTKGKGCLIVAEKSGLTNSGAVIDFTIVDGKLRFRVNEENAKKHNLLISSQLIQLSMK